MKNTQNPQNAPETAQNPENEVCTEADQNRHEWRLALDFDYFIDFYSQLNTNK